MVHDDWLDAISAAADDQLDALELARLDEHLATCPPCAALLDTFQQQRRWVRFQQPVPRLDLVDAVATSRRTAIEAQHRATRTLARRGGFALATVAAAIMGFVAVSSSAAPQPRTPGPDLARLAVQIDAGSGSFDRTDIEVPAGTTVVWHNGGGTTHHLVRKIGAATVTGNLPPGQSEQATFAEAGTYEYYCTIHPEMTGTVTVDA